MKAKIISQTDYENMAGDPLTIYRVPYAPCVSAREVRGAIKAMRDREEYQDIESIIEGAETPAKSLETVATEAGGIVLGEEIVWGSFKKSGRKCFGRVTRKDETIAYIQLETFNGAIWIERA